MIGVMHVVPSWTMDLVSGWIVMKTTNLGFATLKGIAVF
jgi:hypothetical protein